MMCSTGGCVEKACAYAWSPAEPVLLAVGQECVQAALRLGMRIRYFKGNKPTVRGGE